jgi:beta-glucosidase
MGVPVKLSKSDFPTDFLWGAATASYQIEGGATEGGRGPSIWDTFSHTPGKTKNGDTGDIAVDHYHRFREDVGLMAKLGLKAYRFSISWSRLLPSGTGEVNREGVQFYRSLCQELIDSGIQPVATLYHWDLPQALHERGGWVSPESIEWFKEYTRIAKEELGDLIRTWATFNEPWCTAFLGYSGGNHAPGIIDPPSSLVAAHHLMLAHHAAVAVMRRTNVQPDDKLGIVLNLIPAWPADASPEAVNVAEGADAVQNLLYAQAVLSGTYPDRVLQIHSDLGVADRIDLDALAAAVEPIDFLGVNYYNVNHFGYSAGAEPLGAWPGVREATLDLPPGPLTEMGWGVEPEGLVWMLKRINTWSPGLEIMITENGAAYPDVVSEDGSIHDMLRTEYVKLHIAAIAEAIQSGVNVKGYFLWSLLDNFEWARGYDMRFGIIHVDYETMERTIKDSGYWYQRFLAG